MCERISKISESASMAGGRECIRWEGVGGGGGGGGGGGDFDGMVRRGVRRTCNRNVTMCLS